MTQNQSDRTYLALDSELQTRINIAYATARKGRESKYSRSDFLQTLIRERLDERDDVIGSKAALSNRVGDRLIAKIDNLLIILLAIFHLIATRSNIPDALRNQSFIWAIENKTTMEDRVAELRNAAALRHAKSINEDA